MKFALFLAIATALAQYPIQLVTEKSVMDQLYGDLVDTEYSNMYKANSGLEPPAEPDFSIQAVNSGSYLRDMEAHERQTRAAQHHHYIKHRPKYNLPEDDDTLDLSNRLFFGGIVTFAGFPHFNCFDESQKDKPIDIAIVGAPFDTGTSFRPGARFGPDSIRSAAKRLAGGLDPVRGNTRNNPLNKIAPYDPSTHNLTIIDCGDVPMTPFDNTIALNQLYRGHRAIHRHPIKEKATTKAPRIITLGGDHTITLLNLRSVYEQYGKVAVLHFDSHIDTWDPKRLGGGFTDYMALNHGTFLHYAAEQGYLAQDHCFHVGLRAPYGSPDVDHDKHFCGFHTITARDLDTFGRQALVDKIKKTVGDLPVYISLDIDVLDPANAPGTGTMEIGGWTGREVLSFLDSLTGINLVGADVVEVLPPYDSNSEITSLAATAVVDSFLGLMIFETQQNQA